MHSLKVILACATLSLAPTTGATAAPASLPNDTAVRVKSSGLGGGWRDGRIGTSPAGCTMIYLREKAPGGYTAVSLVGADALQRNQGGTWTDVAVKPLRAAEPKDCREGDND